MITKPMSTKPTTIEAMVEKTIAQEAIAKEAIASTLNAPESTQKAPQHWVFLRGLSREARHWGDFPLFLQKKIPNTHCHLIDLPGTGIYFKQTSPASISKISRITLKRIHEKIGHQTYNIIALSMGAMVAIEMARKKNSHVSRLILINSSSRLSSVFQRIHIPTLLGLLYRAHKPLKIKERAILEAVCNNKKNIEKNIQHWVDIQGHSPCRFSTALKQLFASAIWVPPKTIDNTQILILCSKNDRLVSYHCSKKMSAYYQCHIQTHRWAGHDIPLDDPHWVIEKIRQWSNNSHGRFE